MRKRGNIVVMVACISFIMLSLVIVSIGVATSDGTNPFPPNGGSTQPVSAIPPSEDPFLIETSTDITCSGSVTESVSFDWAYTNKNLSDNTLTNDERVAQIRYDEHTSATGGYTEFSKDFTADGLNVPNLHVDKKVGFIANQSMTGGLDSTEDAGIFIVSEGITGGGSGTGGLCIWAQHACVPPSCEIAVAGSQLKDVTRVNSHTITSVQTSESPRLHHEITAKGAMMGDNRTYGAGIGTGTVSAGMKVDVREGNNCNNTVHPLGSRLRYTTISTATGQWNSFAKSMTYTSAIPALQIPGQYPLFPWY